MATLYLHVGMLKTGTTAIQRLLVDNPEALAKQGAVYPDFGLKYPWVNVNRNACFLSKYFYEEETAAKCFEKINALADQYETILMSDEGLWKGGGGGGGQFKFWKNLKAHLRDDIQIRMVAYLRRQDAYIYSYWSQQIKAQQPNECKTMSFPEYISGDAYRRNKMDFRQYFRAGIHSLGKENVLVRVYEKDQFAGGSLYADFLQTVGLELTDDFTFPDQLTNISIRGNVLEAKRRLNTISGFTSGGHRILPYLERVQKKMEENGTLRERNDFPREKRLAFLKDYEDSNRWVAQELLGREDGVLFYEEIKEDREPESTYEEQEIIEVYGRLILELMDEINRLNREMGRTNKKAKQHRKAEDRKGKADRKTDTSLHGQAPRTY